MNQSPIGQSEERALMCIGEDARWAEAVFACLEKIVDLTKEQNFTKDTAETVRILADTARRLEETD